MKQSPKKPAMISLEYTGPSHRCYRDLPTLKTGDTVVVDEGRVPALVATGDFKKVKKLATENKPAEPAEKE